MTWNYVVLGFLCTHCLGVVRLRSVIPLLLTIVSLCFVKCKMCEQDLHDDHRNSEKESDVSMKNIPASITLKPE